MNFLKVIPATPERKAAYLEEQKRIAAPFIKLGGASKQLGEERIAESLRVTSLPEADFEDYTENWIPLNYAP